jgi:hypothetical protein
MVAQLNFHNGLKTGDGCIQVLKRHFSIWVEIGADCRRVIFETGNRVDDRIITRQALASVQDTNRVTFDVSETDIIKKSSIGRYGDPDGHLCPIRINPVFLMEDISRVDADSKIHASMIGQFTIFCFQAMWNLYGAVDGIH